MKQLLDPLKRIWSEGNAAQRVLGVLSLLVVAIGIAGGVYFASRPDHALLFGGLDPADAALVVDEVKKAGASAEVRGGGTAVYVESGRVDEMRMVVARAGLPKSSGSGWSLFDEPGFGVSDFVQNVNYLRALQTELSRAIGEFEGVEGANVQVSRAKRSAFISEERPAKASVIIAMESGRRMSPENVRAVTYLVAGAVEGLDPTNVSVMDNRGRLLSEAGEASLTLNASNQVGYERDVEDYLRGEAERLLALAGVAASVSVNLELDFQHKKSTSEKYDPTGTVVSETIESTTSNDGAPAQKGPVSAKSQLDEQSVSNAQTASAESKESTKSELKVGRTVTSEENATPRVEKMFVSLVVHEQHQEKLTQIEDIVKGAVGFDDTRGDVLKSMTAAFEVAGPAADAPPAPMWPALVERGIQVLGILGALILLFKLVKVLEVKPERTARIANDPGAVHSGAPGSLPIPQRGGVAASGPAEPTLPDFVRDTVKSDPAAATRVLQSWLRDGETN